MQDINKKALSDFLMNNDRVSPRNYVLIGLFVTITVGFLLDFITFGLSAEYGIHVLIMLLIVLMTLVGIVCLFYVNKNQYIIFLHKSIFAFCISAMCLLGNVGFFSFMYKGNIIFYSIVISILVIIVAIMSHIYLMSVLCKKPEDSKKQKYLFMTSAMSIYFIGNYLGRVLGKNFSQSTNQYFLYISMLIIGCGLVYVGTKFGYKYILALKYRTTKRH